MDGDPVLNALRGLYQDLSALSRNALPNVQRLVFELDATVGDFKKLLDKEPKKNESRQAILSGKITLHGVEYSLNDDFQQDVLQVADALDIDEKQAAEYYMQAQLDSLKLDRSAVLVAIIRFHERRAFLLECLRLILRESFEVEREETRALMQDVVAMVLEIQNGPLRNGSLYARKCMDSMGDIERWLVLLGEQIQKASIVGQVQTSDVMEVIEYQRQSLGKQHESLGAILSYLFKGTFTSSEDFRKLLERVKKIKRFDMLLVHYIPALIFAIAQYGSSEGQVRLQEAKSLHLAISGNKESANWTLPKFHAALVVFWLAEYAGWYFDCGPQSELQSVNPAEELATLTQMFMNALEDGGLEFILSVCAGTSVEEWDVPARDELVGLLLKDAINLTVESDPLSPYFRSLLMEGLETFTESLIANIPDAIRQLKSEEDMQRLDQMTALREASNTTLQRGLVEPRMHLESLLVIIAFTFENRYESAQDFWADTDGNLYGFLQWVSKRQTVPRVSAFCEMLCSLSGGEENSASAHRFLLDEDASSPKFRRSTSMNWDQMFAELHLYATRVTERPSAAQPSILRSRKPETVDVDEPESPVMLTCYLRLISHLCKENGQIRQWILEHPTANLPNTLLTLCAAPIPHHLRAVIFVTLRCLMIQRTTAHGNDMWTLIDQWISGSGASPLSLMKLPALTNSPALNERHAFERIIESFDQTNAFVELLTILTSPTVDAADSEMSLYFPESLGSSYRMPGIEPYIDFIMGQALANKSVVLDGKESRVLQLNSLNFAAVGLESFNENLITLVNQAAISANTNIGNIPLATYLRLHPFSRVMEWLFNEDVLRAVFLCSHQDIDDVARASSESVLVCSLIRSIEVMNLILEHQATFFDIVRPFIRSLPRQGASNMASASLASFEDGVMDNLSLISDLCLYCGTGHPQLTLVSLALLEKLSASRKLNKLTSTFSQWQTSNQIVELLNTNVEADRISRSLASQMVSDIRELENGPVASGYLIKLGLVQLLDRCLKMIPNKPALAHVLLGFRCVGNTLDVAPGGLFENNLSLLHAIIEFVKTYPDGTEGVIESWMVHLKRLAFQVLQYLWTSSLSSPLVLPELRASRLLANVFTSQQIISPDSSWDSFRMTEPEFWFSESAVALSEFLVYRSLVLDYAMTEIRAASKETSPSFQRDILSTLFGSSTSEDGNIISHPSIFDLFDFADIDVEWAYAFPDLKYFKDVDVNICAASQENGLPIFYDLPSVQSLLQLAKEHLLSTGLANVQDEEQLSLEQEKLLLFLRATNQSRQVRYNRLLTLKAWVELIITTIVTCHIEPTRMATFILHTLQTILPKLENSIAGNTAEATELARLAEILIEKLDTVSTSANEDIVDERLHHLFQTCIRGIPSVLEETVLRETFYHICSRYLTRITQKGDPNTRFGIRAQKVIKASGSGLIDTICDDAYSGDESCRVSALVFLNLLSVLGEQQSSPVLVTLISQSNYLSLFLDVVRSMASEFRNIQGTETSRLLLFYEALLSLLQQLSQSKTGAIHLLDAGLFQAVKESQIFAADPDIGLDIDNPDALRRYYDLLLSVLRVIISAVFTRGLHNQQIVEQTRHFLAENRQSMVGIFKRYAKIGGLEGAGTQEYLEELVKSYVALITAVGYLEFEEDQSKQPTTRKLFS